MHHRAVIGRRENRLPARLSVFSAWLIWVGLHIAMLLGNRTRFATLINLVAWFNLAAWYLTKGIQGVIVGEVLHGRDLHRKMRAHENPRATIMAREAHMIRDGCRPRVASHTV